MGRPMRDAARAADGGVLAASCCSAPYPVLGQELPSAPRLSFPSDDQRAEVSSSCEALLLGAEGEASCLLLLLLLLSP